MLNLSTRLRSYFIISVVTLSVFPLHCIGDTPEAAAESNAYAAKLWTYMTNNKLVGEGRMRSFPFEGRRPHGSIQEIISTEAEINGERGRLIVKHNYGAKHGLTPQEVYADNQSENYEALTIMFQREEGYDTPNNNWFWAEYRLDGSIINYGGVDLSGRPELCLGCHTPLGGKDREILNGSEI